MEKDIKPKTDILAWIASVAVSVLSCSVIFVIFASYITDIKRDVNDVKIHVSLIDKQQQQTVSEIEFLQKRMLVQEKAQEKTAMPTVTPDAIAVTAPAAPSAIPALPENLNAAAPVSSPAVVAPIAPVSPNVPAVPTATAPAAPTTAPTITVPVMPAPADKK